MKKTELKTKLCAIHTVLAEPASSALQLSRMTNTAYTMLANLLAEIGEEPESEIGKMEVCAGARATGGLVRADAPATAATLLPNLDGKMVLRLTEGFDACVNLWDNKEQRHYQLPDTKTRLEAVKLYLGYRLGMPPQMRVNIEASAHKDRHSEMLELARTPSGRDTLLRLGAVDEEWLAKYVPGDSQK